MKKTILASFVFYFLSATGCLLTKTQTAVKVKKPKVQKPVKVKLTSRLVPQFTYQNNHQNIKPLRNAVLQAEPIQISFQPTWKYKKVNVVCCKEIDQQGEPIGAASLTQTNQKISNVFNVDLSQKHSRVRELRVDGITHKNEIESFNFIFYVDQVKQVGQNN